MAQRNLKVGAIKDVSGEVNIAGGDIYKGYTSEQVSFLLKQITTTFTPKPFDGRCPYKGLDVFEEEDAELFFGRERLVEDLVSRVRESRTLFITGPSGSGKSSLVRAGLIPALKSGAIKALHSERWFYETMKPGRDPLAELGRVVSRLAGTLGAGEDIRTKGLSDATVLSQWYEIALKEGRDKRAVLFVDQFEEVFTQISDEMERQAFLNLLTHAATIEKERVILLFAMRSDFVSNCALYPELNALLNQQFIQIGAMQPDELVSAIAQPALRVGLRIDPDLIAQIINDMQGEPGALPLMQFALKDLFDVEQARGGMIALTREAYLQRGGIHKSLERHADNAFAKLSEHEQELAHSIFERLIEIGYGTQDTRRTALFDELIPANTKTEDVGVIVQKLADARLIITDEQAGKDTVTISHEKLIDAWPWLKKLVNENRDVIALQNEIANDAKEWDEHRRDASYLYTGARLINAREQLESKKLVLSGLAQEFVEAGRARQRRGQLSFIAAISIIIALLGIAVIVFSRQSSDNAKLAQQARLRELAAQSALLRDRNLQTSLLLGLEVFQRWDIPQTRGVLLDNVQTHPQLRQFLSRHSGGVNSIAFSPNRKILASGSEDNTIILWDLSTYQPIGEPLRGHSGLVSSVAFSPDGETLVSAGTDKTILLWDLATHQPLGEPLKGHSGSVNSIAFSPNGETLASGSDDHTIILWDLETRQPLAQPLTGHENSIYSLAFSPSGKILASGGADRTIILWDLTTHQPIGEALTGHTGSIYSLAFSPDGKILASGSDDNTIILWDIETHQPIDEPLTGHASRVSGLAFHPNGKILASGGFGSTIILWDMATHQPIGQPLTGHTGSIYSLAFSLDGQTLVSGGFDNTIILWDVVTRRSIARSLGGQSGSANSVAFSPDGKILASGFYDSTIILWDTIMYQPIGEPLRGHSGPVSSVAFSPDGKILASGSDDKKIILWDLSTHQPIGQPLIGHTSRISSLAFHPDGKLLASGEINGNIILWDMATHQPVGQPLTGHSSRVNSIAFSPSGEILASGGAEKTIILWDVATLQPIDQPLSGHKGSIYSLVFSPNGQILASGSDDNTIILWGVETHQASGQPLAGHASRVSSLAFSLDGKILASGGFDSTIILWDVATHQPIGQPLIGHTGSIYSVAISPDGQKLASGSVDNTVILWDIDPQSWIIKTCQRVGRNFTAAEWQQYFSDEEYRKTCPQWSLEREATPVSNTLP